MTTENDREFNDAGLCVPHLHYMADRSAAIEALVKLVEKGKYFTINRPRQYGKTTLLYLLQKELEEMGYLVFKISFEGVGDSVFSSEERFAPAFLKMLRRTLKQQPDLELSQFLLKHIDLTHSLQDLSDVITEMTGIAGKNVVLQVDEVDKAGNNQLFLSFLGMLRAKYLLRNEGTDTTFFSVILAGVHDVKNLKVKLRSKDEEKYNSPWNIAVDLKVDLSLKTAEIESLLRDFLSQNDVPMDTGEVAGKLGYLTSGHPFLVSRLCKIVHEDLKPAGGWDLKWLDIAVNVLSREDNTNFKSVIKNLENNSQLYDMVYNIVIEGKTISYNRYNPTIEQGITYGVFSECDDRVKIHNRVYEQLIYNYMTSKIESSVSMGNYNYREHFLEKDGALNLREVILRFQAFMKEQFSKKDEAFLERNGRLLFLAFLKPIINGRGFDFKEVEISEEKRLDIAVTYGDKKYIVELKKWYGEKPHRAGLEQLADYLERQDLKRGYLVIFDSRKTSHKIGDSETVTVASREIFVVWV